MKFNGFKNIYGTWGRKNRLIYRSRYLKNIDKDIETRDNLKQKGTPSLGEILVILILGIFWIYVFIILF